jgi:anaerobic ribonucleoside-triphosphate reductase
MLPLYYHGVDLFKRLEIFGKLMNLVSGGSILHLNLKDNMSAEVNRKFNYMIIEKYNIPHYAINIGDTTCVEGHVTPGIHWDGCPQCGAAIYTHTIRVVGFETDTVDWVKARRVDEWEVLKREFFSVDNILAELQAGDE